MLPTLILWYAKANVRSDIMDYGEHVLEALSDKLRKVKASFGT